MPTRRANNKTLKIISVTLIFLCGVTVVFAQNFSKGRFNKPADTPLEKQVEKKENTTAERAALPVRKKKKDLNEFQQLARIYRQQGLEYQDAGNLEAALTFYQKAIDLDPWYAVAYNDLGIIFEAKNDPERAEASYLQAIKIDPEFLSPYSNLAVLYETRHDLKSALGYWKKRARLGDSVDDWTQKARQRGKDIELVLYGPAQQEDRQKIAKEKDIAGLAADVSAKKKAAMIQPPVVPLEKREKPQEILTKPCKSNKTLAQETLHTARLSEKKGKNAAALKEGIDAKLLDPDNPEIDEFLDKLLTKTLAK